MRFLKYILPLSVFAAGLVFTTTTGLASVETSKKEKKACIVCHIKMGTKDLNGAGKYYKEKKTLDGYQK